MLDLVSYGVVSKIVKSLGTSKCSGTNGSVKASGSLGASGSSVNRLPLYVYTNMYICVAISEGLLIAGKEDQVCVETLYVWVIGFEKNSTVSELGEASMRLLKN
ncbi:hypothetical protein Tco_0587677, partial [Tanacetum coccineum]